MKRLTLILPAMFVIASFASAGTRVSFQLAGGLNYATGGDISRGLIGYDEYLKKDFAAAGGFEKPALGYQFSGEFLYHFSDRIAAGLSVGYFEHLKESRVTYDYFGVISVAETFRPKFRVLPLSAVFHYYLPLSNSLRLDAFAGAGGYLTSFDYMRRQDLSLLGFNGSDVYTFKSARTGFGGHLGIGLEWVIDPKFSVLLNMTGRLASVSEFVGDWTDVGQGDFWSYNDSGSDHRIWAGQWTVESGTYDFVIFDAPKPEADGYADVHEARLGLTGFAATLGFKVGLF